MNAPFVSFTVPGRPAQMGSKRIFRRAGKPCIGDDNDKKKREWNSIVRYTAFEAMRSMPITEVPVRLVVVFKFARPRGHFGTGRNSGKLKASAPDLHAQSPDLDKLVRCLGDALTGIVWRDDRQVCELTARREWTVGPECACVEVFDADGAAGRNDE